MRCPSCQVEMTAPGRFCPECGSALSISDLPTRLGDVESAESPAPAPSRPSLTSSDSLEGRFIPGTLLGERYRIVGLLGKGGMGEVYRAHDLTLGQPVAVKFLPESMEKEQGRVARFLNEVRLARLVSHPNVCTVYDVGQVDGQHFISMEYVDGEDLASLLRRIGRLPRDKAVQIARQLCAGVAAAHEQGIIHRDLKPTNVMIDGRGRVRITDFGLAGLAEGDDTDARVGTPAYMAPEQLAGKGVSTRSDVYSLGLVLYELFTGAPAFEAKTVPELMRMQEDSSPTPSRDLDDIEPAVEQVILRCLSYDPAQRPASALAVAAALPGGDPLAEALAAGETPSPEMVADAGEAGGLSPGWGLACLLVLAAGFLASIALAGRVFLHPQVPLPKPPQALAVEAQQILADAGFREEPVHRSWGFRYNTGYLDHVESRNRSSDRWRTLSSVWPAPMLFWYRQSPRYLVPANYAGGVGYLDPPLRLSGMANLLLNPDGRLVELLVVPPQKDESEAAADPPDWAPLFKRAGLDGAAFREVVSVWNPLIDCDLRRAWVSEEAERDGMEVRVEAGGYRGRPVYFRIFRPWDSPGRMEEAGQDPAHQAVAVAAIIIFLLVLAAAILLAWRNVRMGRGDRQGAFRLALFVFGASFLAWMLAASHVPALSEFGLFVWGLQSAFFPTLLSWLAYLAIEPYVRRLWPNVLIAWSRLLDGRWRDPLVGRDILLGSVAGAVIGALGLAAFATPAWMGQAGARPQVSPLAPTALKGLGGGTAMLAQGVIGSLISPLILLMMILLFQVLLRRRWIAYAGVYALLLLVSVAQSPGLFSMLLNAVALAGSLYLMIRLGFLAYVVFSAFQIIPYFLPITLDLSHWTTGPSLLFVLLFMSIAVFGFVISLAGRSLLGEGLLLEKR